MRFQEMRHTRRQFEFRRRCLFGGILIFGFVIIVQTVAENSEISDTVTSQSERNVYQLDTSLNKDIQEKLESNISSEIKRHSEFVIPSNDKKNLVLDIALHSESDLKIDTPSHSQSNSKLEIPLENEGNLELIKPDNNMNVKLKTNYFKNTNSDNGVIILGFDEENNLELNKLSNRERNSELDIASDIQKNLDFDMLYDDLEYRFIDALNGTQTHKRIRPNFWSNKVGPIKPTLGVVPHKNHTKETIARPVYSDPDFSDDDMKGSFDRHPCRRVCQQGQVLSCYYKLVLHNYQRLGPECQRCQYDASACEAERCIYGDGVPSAVMAVNRMVPAPPIEVCENDTLIVDVLNYLTESSTMHWHGLHMSQTPEMDGGPFVTQYPVQPGEVYRYTFPADRSGTIWYHSHLGWQRALGIAGAFVIRQTRANNRQAHLYDYDLIEHTLMIQDIVYNYDFTRVTNILINGKGRNHLTTLPDNDPRNRYERLRVTPGYRYRMRVISNGVFNCPIEFSIENHKMLMIATDGNDIEPIYADSFFMSSAERFDFVLEANQYAGNYWIRVRGYGNCSMENLYQGAVLHYRGAARNEPPFTVISESQFGRRALDDAEEEKHVVVNYLQEFEQTKIMNNIQPPKDQSTNIATAGLRALEPLPWQRYTKFLTYYSSFGTRALSNGVQLFQIDDITFELPGVSLLQARHLYDEDSYFCNRTAFIAAGRNCLRENCECTNVIRLPAYKPIEMVVVNYMDTTHPFHTHGYTFRLVGQGVVGNVADLRRIRDLDRRGLLQRAPADFPAVEKDTIQIPGLGYIIVRFISDNPGFWMYHCHIELHAIQGMVAVLKIGENHQMKRIPPKIRC